MNVFPIHTTYIYNKTSNVCVTSWWGVSVQPLLQWKCSKYHIIWVYVCSLRYPAYNEQAPCYHMWPAPLYSIFITLAHQRHVFRKENLLSIKCVFLISLQFLSEILFIKRRTERDMIKNVYWPSCKVSVFLSYLNEKLKFSGHIFEKYLNFVKISCTKRTDRRREKRNQVNGLSL